MLCYVKRIRVYTLSWVHRSTLTLITWLQCDGVGDHLTQHGYAYLRHDEHPLNDVRSNGCRINVVCKLNMREKENARTRTNCWLWILRSYILYLIEHNSLSLGCYQNTKQNKKHCDPLSTSTKKKEHGHLYNVASNWSFSSCFCIINFTII